jgi:DNA repair protein RadC
LITLPKDAALTGIHSFRMKSNHILFLKEKTKYNSSEKSHTVRDLPYSERPRERLYNLGADKLSDSELLAIILRTGMKGESVLLLAQKLISHYGSLNDLFNASVDDLKKRKEIGPAKAIELSACFELGRRINSKNLNDIEAHLKKEIISDPEIAADVFRRHFTDLTREQFLLASFDTRSRLLGVDNVSTGTLTASLVHPREVYKAAIKRHAAAIIAAHNHPSNDTEPSEEDFKTTTRLVEAGKIMGIQLLDHLIITANNFYSFKENGKL